MGFISTHASDREVYTQLLVRMDLPSGTLYLTDSMIPIKYNSQQWVHRGFHSPEIDRNKYDLSGGLSFSFANADNYWSTILLAGSGSPIYVYEAWFTVGQLTVVPQEVVLLRRGRIGRPSITATDASFDVTAYTDYEAIKAPSRDWGTLCQFSYKGTGCQATGSDTTCDLSLASCQLPTKLAATANITNRSRTSNVATLTTSVAHGFSIGQIVQVYLMSDATFNAVAAVTGTPSGTQFSYSNAGSNVGSTSESAGKVNSRGPGNSLNYGGIPFLLQPNTESA